MGTTTPGDTPPSGDSTVAPTARPPGGEETGEPGVPVSAKRRARPSAVAILVFVAAAVLAGDAIAKYFVVEKLTDHPPVRALGGLVYLDLIRNSGAAFSMLSDQTWVFTVVATLAVGWICWLAFRLRSSLWALALGLVLGGALGNLADRVFREPGFPGGHVVDYLSLFGPNGEHFAIFNLADAMLSVGVALAILLELIGVRRDGTRAGRKSAGAGHGAAAHRADKPE